MNRNSALFTLMALEMAIIAELLNNLTFVVVEVDDDYDDMPLTEDETILNRSIVDEQAYGEDDVVKWLTNECGLNVNKSATDYAPNTKMMALSVDEMRQIKREMDALREKVDKQNDAINKLVSLL